ncbi:hypothetical protein SAMN04488168_101430 [Bacillus sp. 491mf]|uniref:hypothetical protein n=1 Tax=Bacillus TaxID=1386 RepID=UPI000553DB90|nr:MULTISPECIES: hypothetical protein [unclassified Bacillus (in: firmicutes)]SFC00499.1 hypothetical protein SAMN04488168_101430 [Bacillus sp. 491mf]
MKRKLLAVTLPILLVAGVGCSKDSSETKTDSLKSAETGSQEVSKSKATETNVEKEYKSNLNSLLSDITKQAQELTTILTSDKPFEEKEKEYMKKSDIMSDTADKVIALEPGEKYTNVHIDIKGAMLQLKTGTLLIRSGMNMKNDEFVHKGGEETEKASKMLIEADKKFKEIK